MENRPAIMFTGLSPALGANPEDLMRQRKWESAAYPGVIMSIPEVTGLDQYAILRENPQYPDWFSISHYKSLQEWKNSANSHQRAALGIEFKSWIDRGTLDYVWSATYTMLKSFRSRPVFFETNEDTRIERAPVIQLEAYRFTPEERDKYLKWFGAFGRALLQPIFRQITGFVGYDWYEYTGLRMREYATEIEYPENISISYFENIKAYQDWLRSPELVDYHKALRSVIPRRLSYQWYVQYELYFTRRK
jgi:heme-degrading monooxygenase HmoA